MTDVGYCKGSWHWYNGRWQEQWREPLQKVFQCNSSRTHSRIEWADLSSLDEQDAGPGEKQVEIRKITTKLDQNYIN